MFEGSNDLHEKSPRASGLSQGEASSRDQSAHQATRSSSQSQAATGYKQTYSSTEDALVSDAEQLLQRARALRADVLAIKRAGQEKEQLLEAVIDAVEEAKARLEATAPPFQYNLDGRDSRDLSGSGLQRTADEDQENKTSAELRRIEASQEFERLVDSADAAEEEFEEYRTIMHQLKSVVRELGQTLEDQEP